MFAGIFRINRHGNGTITYTSAFATLPPPGADEWQTIRRTQQTAGCEVKYHMEGYPVQCANTFDLVLLMLRSVSTDSKSDR